MDGTSKQTPALGNHFIELLYSTPREIDLGDESLDSLIYKTVSSLIDEGYSLEEIDEITDALILKNDSAHYFMLLCLKLAKSKIMAAQTNEPVFISVVFAVYKENNRIQSSANHPHGENFLLRKIKQLEWLFNEYQHVRWELIIVDDGCPDDSGKVAQELIEKHGVQNKARVLFLADAIEQKLAPAKSIQSVNESQKGGAIIYGIWDAVQRPRQNHFVVYTDADLSTHLGQVMLLIYPMIKEDKKAVIGSRREARSVVIKQGMRNERGKLFIYLWKRMIPNLGDIVDTQCGFKAFRADCIGKITENLIEKKFAFDIELLLRTELLHPGSIKKIPLAWIDSEEASTTKDLQPYLAMLKSIAEMNRKYFADQKTNEFVEFITELKEEQFQSILENIPENIVNRTPDAFTTYDEIRVADFLST